MCVCNINGIETLFFKVTVQSKESKPFKQHSQILTWFFTKSFELFSHRFWKISKLFYVIFEFVILTLAQHMRIGELRMFHNISKGDKNLLCPCPFAFEIIWNKHVLKNNMGKVNIVEQDEDMEVLFVREPQCGFCG